MHRFYSEHADLTKTTLMITDKDELHHMRDVLKVKVGDKVGIFNGEGEEARVVVTGIDASAANFKVEEVIILDRSLGIKIILACAVPKKAKFESIIEKCTELGVDTIIPLRTQRSDVVFSKEKISAKQERFKKVAINAAKQCKRGNVPNITPMMDLKDVLQQRDRNTLAVFPCLVDKPLLLRDALKSIDKGQTVYIFIGPEGDFTPHEVDMAKKNGCVPVSLGNTVLKVDTAAMASVAYLRLYLSFLT